MEETLTPNRNLNARLAAIKHINNANYSEWSTVTEAHAYCMPTTYYWMRILTGRVCCEHSEAATTYSMRHV